MTESDFHTVWIPLQGRFYRIAYFILESEADAKDAVQELYLKLWNLRDHLELVHKPSAYGTMLLKNLCIDRIRRARSAGPPDQALALEPSAEAALEAREELGLVQKAIDMLPATQRKLLSLRIFDGLSYEEIAQKTGLSPLNIRVQVSLARKRIKQSL